MTFFLYVRDIKIVSCSLSTSDRYDFRCRDRLLPGERTAETKINKVGQSPRIVGQSIQKIGQSFLETGQS